MPLSLDKLNIVHYIYIVKFMGTKERKQRDKKEMVDNILNAAMKLFLTHGYKNVTIRKIAHEIEYSPAAIYLYFKDKEEILLALQTLAFGKFYEAQISVQNIEDPVERLVAHGKVYIDFALANPEYYDLMFIMEQPVIKKPEEWHTGINSYDLLRKNVKECTDKGLLKYDNYEAVSFALWAFVHGIAAITIKRGMMVPNEYKDAMLEGAFEFLKQSIYK